VLVGPFGIASPFLVIAALTIVAVALVWRTKIEETPEDQAPTQRLALDLLRYRPFLGAVVLGTVVFVMIGLFDSLWAVALDDLAAPDWLANLGISLFAVPLIVLSAFGGRLAQRFGPFRLATLGPLVGAVAMIGYATVPTSGAMFTVAMVHALSDGLTIASSGIAAGLTVPPERQAGGQGVLGAAETLAAGITAVCAGVLYQHFGRAFAYTSGAVAMVVLTGVGVLLARPAFALREVPLTATV
jgi:predicted MFS family arabinose efflux permease